MKDREGAGGLRNRLARLAQPELRSLAQMLNGLAILVYFLVAAQSGQLAELEAWLY